MSPKLLHIYGPLCINAYGLFIALGIGVGIFLLSRDEQFSKIISLDLFINCVVYLCFVGIVGGRLLFAAQYWSDLPSLLYIFELWRPGYSILGTVFAVALAAYFFFKRHNIAAVPLMDRLAIYAPLTQAIGRLGCFVAGCCYGTETNISWAVCYSNSNVFAPLGVMLHPTQLYSVALLLLVSVLLYRAQYFCTRPGLLVGLYLMGIAGERFVVDFFRADHTVVLGILSGMQLVAVVLFGTGCLIFYVGNNARK